MTGAPPKPEKRGPKERQRIRRSDKPIARTGRIERKAKKRKPKKAKVLKRGWLEKVCDSVMSLWFRSRRKCEVCNREFSVPELQWSHFWERTWRRIRYAETNACSSCAGCHVFATHHGTYWSEWCRGYVTMLHGAEAWNRLSSDARLGPLPDHVAIIARYWPTPEVQGALAECSEKKIECLTRDVNKVLWTVAKTGSGA